ncbi:MAG: amidohydrolase family protein, partial [Bacteroidetes bacterium]|nr:amidohydrolase family protein [Bacteroidota bacterium]
MKFFVSLLLSVLFLCVSAQSPEPVNGVREPEGKVYALINAIIHTNAGNTLTGNIIIRDQFVQAVSADARIPENAVVLDLTGRHVYPGFVEAWSSMGFEPVRKAGRRQDAMFRNNDGTGDWNMAIQPEFDASTEIHKDDNSIQAYRDAGFTTVCSHREDGIMQGTGIIFNTGEGSLNELTIKSRGARFFSFDKGSSPMDYPSSLMGSIALFRQTMLNLDWYEKGGKKEYSSRSLEALSETSTLPAFFKGSSWRDVMRISSLKKEFGIPFMALDNGDSYQRAKAIAAEGIPLLLTLNYPEAWNVKDAAAAGHISWDDMQHYFAAPANAELLRRQGVLFGFSSDGLKSPGEFMKALTKAVRAGLPSAEALKAATETPSRWLGIWEQTGSIENGKYANLFVSRDTLFSDDWKMELCFVEGKLYYTQNPHTQNLAGNYSMQLDGREFPAVIKSEDGKLNIEIKDSLAVIKASLEISDNRVDFTIKEKGPFYLHRFNGNISAINGGMQIIGSAYPVQGNSFGFALIRSEISVIKKADPDKPEPFIADDFMPRYPFHAFGNDSLPAAETILFEGATIWTCESDAQPFIGDVLVSEGKIIACALKINPAELKIKSGWKVVNATGKHITPGIIDEHSHIAIERGVNEGSQNNTAEVRITDAVNGEDPAIFYQLMGGVTSAQLLHGSANPIGGQSAVIKLRWGETPAGLINKNAPGHIKFALGENVKQSNWGDNKRSRFPQTRMGVEQVYYDAFQRAKEYIASKEAAADKKNKNTAPVRKDLELEAIQEIIEGNRFITCH